MKALKSLEIIKNAPTIYVGCASDIYTRYPFECKEIETALKRLEKIETTTHSVLREDISKKLKALEIIKEKNVFVWSFLHRKDFEYTYDYYKKCYGYFHSGYDYKLLTEEEFNLLKEVML